MKNLILLSFFATALFACNKNKTESTTAAMSEHKMTPELTAFHDVMAPLWHAEAGDKRMKETCGSVGKFEMNAESVKKASAPTGVDAMTWSTAATKLGTDVAALKDKCTATDAAAFEPAFANVHNSFHGMMELAGGEMHKGEGADKMGGEHDGNHVKGN
jgi:hypothetical protein